MPLAVPGVAPAARAIVGNGNRFPSYYQADSRSVINQIKRRRSSSTAAFSDLRFTYAGFAIANGGEIALDASFTLRAGLVYAGGYYPVTFNGSRDWVVPRGKSFVQSDPVRGLVLPPGAMFGEITRRVSNAAGDKVLVSAGWEGAFGEWSYAGTDASVDYTLGGAPVAGVGYFTIAGGVITSLVTTAISHPGPVVAFDPDTGNYSGTLIANVSTVGTLSGANLANANGPWGPNTRPVYGDVALDVQRRTYHACLITGTPSRAVPSLLMLADSNDIGYSASDMLGNEPGDYGLYERAIGNRIGIAHLSYSGAYSSSLVTESALPTAHAILDPLAADGNLRVLWQACGNDIGGGATTGAVLASMNAGAALWRARGAAVSFATPLVRTTASDEPQTPAAGFAKGGALDDITYAVRYESGLRNDWGYVEARRAVENATTSNVWRSGYTLDGSHPSGAQGLRLASADVVIPPALSY